MPLRAIANRASLVDEVFEQMKELIISGEWGPCAQIPSESELSTLFNVSRTTIRNAIQKLKTIGVLTTKQGQGTFVRHTITDNLAENLIPMVFLDNDNILEILEFRITIEMASASLAAERAGDDDIQRIQAVFEVMSESIENYTRYSIADYQFHLNIARASKNTIFYQAMLKLKDVLYSHFEEMNREFGPAMSIENHRKILAAITSKDPQLASRLMKENIELSIKTLKARAGERAYS